MMPDSPTKGAAAAVVPATRNRPGSQVRRPSVSTYAGLVLGLGALVLAAVAIYTAVRVEQINQLARGTEIRAAEAELGQAIRTLVADSRSILREVALWDETRKQVDNPVYYQFWWRNRLMNPARVPHYVQWMEVYTAERQSLSWINETPLPEILPDERTFLAWDGYGASLFNFVPILDQRGQWPPIGYLGVRISLPLALPEIYQFNKLQPDTLDFDLPPEQQVAVTDLPRYARYQLPATSEMLPLLEAVNRGTVLLVVINVLLFVIGVLLTHKYLVHPLRGMESFVTALRGSLRGSHHTRPPEFRVRELQKLGESLAEYDRDLGRLHADLDRKNSELWDLAHIDALAGTRNRLSFDEDWQALRQQVEESPRSVTFLMIDCDELKSINDHYGHECGDRVIRTVARLIEGCLQGAAPLYRLGGDEFATMFQHQTQDQGQALANLCLKAISDYPSEQLGINEPLCVSIGLASARVCNVDELEQLPNQADAAMYRSKQPAGPKLSVHGAGHHQTGLISDQ